MVPRPLPLPPPSPQRNEGGTGARVAELLQLLHTPLADTLLVAERLNVARINIAVAQTARQDLERQPSKLVDLCVALLLKFARLRISVTSASSDALVQRQQRVNTSSSGGVVGCGSVRLGGTPRVRAILSPWPTSHWQPLRRALPRDRLCAGALQAALRRHAQGARRALPGLPRGHHRGRARGAPPRRRVRDVLLEYKSPEIAPLAQPANPLEATTGEATTGAEGHILGGAG